MQEETAEVQGVLLSSAGKAHCDWLRIRGLGEEGPAGSGGRQAVEKGARCRIGFGLQL